MNKLIRRWHKERKLAQIISIDRLIIIVDTVCSSDVLTVLSLVPGSL